MDKINVLCLHGCNQTQEMFKRLLKNYIKFGEKQYGLKFHFTEAKYDHPDGGKTWYNKPLNVADIGSIKYDEDLVSDTLDDIETIIKDNNIHVLLGFSQGANVVDTFISHRDSGIKCAVIMSGYSLVDVKELTRKELTMPLLGVVSNSDTVVPIEYNPTEMTLIHDKGHKLPTRNSEIRKICIFMQTQEYN